MDGSKFTPKIFDVMAFKNSTNTYVKCVFIVMEYSGCSLVEIIKNYDLNENQLTLLYYNILCALKYIHSANIMHRDFKPDNILVSGNFKIKICDFGLSNVIQEPKNTLKLDPTKTCAFSTKTFSNENTDDSDGSPVKSEKNERVLTPRMSARFYRCPELILKIPSYDEKVDIWALGCIFHELEFVNQIKDDHELYSKLYKRILFRGSSCYPHSPEFN